MILKGSQRTGGVSLATHLLNEFDNEKAELGSLRGFVACDLHGALAEITAMARITKCKKEFYAVSMNPPAPLSRQQYMRDIDLVEGCLGLHGQPRAVVFHVKDGREHAHIAWSRIDPENGKAIHISHDRMKLRSASREIAARRGYELPEGLAEDRGADRFARKDISPAEMAQSARTGITAEERRAAVTAAWNSADSGHAFRAALAEQGYYLARGDKRSFVLIDSLGEIYSLPRQIDGVNTRQVKERLLPLTPDNLPTVDTVRGLIDRGITARFNLLRTVEIPGKAVQARRRGELASKRRALENRQWEERYLAGLAGKDRRRRFIGPVVQTLIRVLGKVPGAKSVLTPLAFLGHFAAVAGHERDARALRLRHEAELREQSRLERDLGRIEAQERRVFEIRFRPKTVVRGSTEGSSDEDEDNPQDRDEEREDEKAAAGTSGKAGARPDRSPGHTGREFGAASSGKASRSTKSVPRDEQKPQPEAPRIVPT